MKIVKINNKESNICFVVNIEKNEWKKMQEKAFKKLAKNIKIPGGFRPGQPAHTQRAKNIISDGEIIEKSINDEVNKINKNLIIQKEFIEIEDDILNMPPELNIDKVDKDELILSFVYKKIPIVSINDYKKISIKLDNMVSGKEIENEKDKFLEKNSELIPKKNQTISKGDFVIFDFEGYINNEKMENGSSKNFELEIGSNQFIPGFEDKMIGLKLNEEKELKLKFPKDYHSKEIANKDAIFKIKINDIKEKKMPKFNDSFVLSLKIDDVKNVKEFNDYITHKIKKEKDEKNKNELRAKLFQEIAKITTLSHEDNFSIEQEKKSIEQEYKNMLSKSGINLESFIEISGQNKEDFYKNIDKQANDNVKVKYAIIEISEKENIIISDKEFENYLNELAKIENIKLEDLKNKISDNIEIIRERLIFDKTINFLIDIATKK